MNKHCNNKDGVCEDDNCRCDDKNDEIELLVAGEDSYIIKIWDSEGIKHWITLNKEEFERLRGLMISI